MMYPVTAQTGIPALPRHYTSKPDPMQASIVLKGKHKPYRQRWQATREKGEVRSKLVQSTTSIQYGIWKCTGGLISRLFAAIIRYIWHPAMQQHPGATVLQTHCEGKGATSMRDSPDGTKSGFLAVEPERFSGSKGHTCSRTVWIAHPTSHLKPMIGGTL